MRRVDRVLCVLALVAAGGAAAQPIDNGVTSMASSRIAAARALASRGHYTEALAKLTRVLDNAPDTGMALYARADLLIAMGRYDDALADVARFEALHPQTRAAHFFRARIALFRRDPRGTLAELDATTHMPWTVVDRGFAVNDGIGSSVTFFTDRSLAEALLGQNDAAVADLQATMQNQGDRPWYALNGYCYVAAIAGELELAELACEEARAKETRNDGAVADSTGFTHLRMHQWDKAIADYTLALADREDLPSALYGRGVARQAKGDLAGANADMTRARTGEPDIANIMARLGVSSTTQTGIPAKSAAR